MKKELKGRYIGNVRDCPPECHDALDWVAMGHHVRIACDDRARAYAIACYLQRMVRMQRQAIREGEKFPYLWPSLSTSYDKDTTHLRLEGTPITMDEVMAESLPDVPRRLEQGLGAMYQASRFSGLWGEHADSEPVARPY